VVLDILFQNLEIFFSKFNKGSSGGYSGGGSHGGKGSLFGGFDLFSKGNKGGGSSYGPPGHGGYLR